MPECLWHFCPVGKLRDIAAVRTGVAPPLCVPELASCSYVQMKDLDISRRALTRALAPTAGRARPIEQGDVLVAARGERTMVSRPDSGLVGAYPSLDIYLVRPEPGIADPDYLAAYLATYEVDQRLRSAKVGSNPPRIPKEALEELEVPLPSLAHQRAVARIYALGKAQMALVERLRVAEHSLNEARMRRALQAIEE